LRIIGWAGNILAAAPKVYAMEMPKGEKIMNTIAVVNNKGGVGKTTSAVTLAAGIAAGSLNPEAKDFDKTVRELFPILDE